MDYLSFKKNLITELETTRDLLVVRESMNNFDMLFMVKTDNDRLYSRILNMFEIIILKNVEYLVFQLCEENGVKCYVDSGNKKCNDMEIEFDGAMTIVDFKTQPKVFDSSAIAGLSQKEKMDRKSRAIVFLLKETIESRNYIDSFNHRIKENDVINTKCYLFEDFIGTVFGQDEKQKFQIEMADFQKEMHQAVGYQVTELCSPHNLSRLKVQLEEELLNFDYDSIKVHRYSEMLAADNNANDLNSAKFDIIKNEFFKNGKYKILLGNSDFATSYITSEWLYKKYFTLDELDNTFIVSGFLKSIEQLLWDVIFIVGQGRSIGGLPISAKYKDDIDKTLGSLERFITNYKNESLFQSNFGNSRKSVMDYLKAQISVWRDRYRNGYFHKHNLKKKDRIEAIREETYFLYLLILGAIRLTPGQIMRLS